jgi:hypothetical protein
MGGSEQSLAIDEVRKPVTVGVKGFGQGLFYWHD